MPPASQLQQSQPWSAEHVDSNRRINRRPGRELQPDTSRPTILIGESDAMKHLGSVIERIARNDNSVLITGATGTGKELVARAIHEKSGRTGQLVGVNCSTLPETLVEAELF